MNRKHILLILFFPVLGLIIGGAVCYLLRRCAPKYTASTYIRVLPPVECGCCTIGAATGAGPAEYAHRKSSAKLITGQSNFEELVNKDKIRETKWFKHFGESKDISIPKAVKDLKRNFFAHADKDTDYILLSMTCSDKEEAATIVNQMVDLFLDSQRITATGEVSDKLTTLDEQLKNVKDELNDAEKALTDVRERTKFTDFEEHGYPNPIVSRLTRLEQKRDNCLLKIRQVQTKIKNLEKQPSDPNNKQIKETQQADLKNAKDSLSILQAEYEELERLRQEAIAQKRDYDLARILYEQRANIRNQARERRNDIENQTCKWKIMYDDPDIAGVRFVGYAPVPLAISSPKWIFYLPAGMILGLILGIVLALLSRKSKVS